MDGLEGNPIEMDDLGVPLFQGTSMYEWGFSTLFNHFLNGDGLESRRFLDMQRSMHPDYFALKCRVPWFWQVVNREYSMKTYEKANDSCYPLYHVMI